MGSGLPEMPDNLIDIIQLIFSMWQRNFRRRERAVGAVFTAIKAVLCLISTASMQSKASLFPQKPWLDVAEFVCCHTS
jgi:hypothetical protein